jgi:hypothetical protein
MAITASRFPKSVCPINNRDRSYEIYTIYSGLENKHLMMGKDMRPLIVNLF